MVDRFFCVFPCGPVEEVSAEHQKALGFWIVGAALHRLCDFGIDLSADAVAGLFAEQPGPDLFDDRSGDVVLDGKDIVHRPVVGFGPELKSVLDLDELDRDADAVACSSDAAFENGRDI